MPNMRSGVTRALRSVVSAHLSKPAPAWRAEYAAPGRLVPALKGKNSALGAGVLAAGRAAWGGAESRGMSGGGPEGGFQTQDGGEYPPTPPSDKQISYLKRICKEMRQEVPQDTWECKLKYSAPLHPPLPLHTAPT